MATTRIPRDIDTAIVTASKEEIIRTLMLVEMVFDSDSLRMNSSSIDLRYNGDIYYGVGDLGKISTVKEGSDLEANGIILTLTGVKQEYISIGLGDDIQGRNVNIYLAFLNEDYHLVKDPVTLGPWKMDTLDIEYGQSCAISLKCESRMAAWNRPKPTRYTHIEQVKQFSGDLGLEYIADMPSREFNWGNEDTGGNTLWPEKR